VFWSHCLLDNSGDVRFPSLRCLGLPQVSPYLFSNFASSNAKLPCDKCRPFVTAGPSITHLLPFPMFAPLADWIDWFPSIPPGYPLFFLFASGVCFSAGRDFSNFPICLAISLFDLIIGLFPLFSLHNFSRLLFPSNVILPLLYKAELPR